MSSKLEEVATLTGHTAQAWSVCFHPTDPLLASCSSDKSIRLYGFTRSLTGTSFQHINTLPAAHNRTVRQVVFSPDGRRMASASFDSTVGIWERVGSSHLAGGGGALADSNDEGDNGGEEWENVGSLEGHESEVKSVAWSHDGGLLATCGRDKSVWVWDANTPDEDFECLAVMMDHTQDVKHVTFSPTEEILASSSYDDTVKLYASDYTTDEWSVTHSLPPAPPKHYHFPNAPEPDADESGTGHTSTVWASSFSPDGSYIASCSDDLSVKIWARYKRKDVKGEPGGAFRVGRTEKEGWYCALTISDLHERAIFSIDWTGAQDSKPSNRTEEMLDLGRIATVGGDGRLSVLGITAHPSEGERNGYELKHTIVASIDNAHGVHDVNCVQWCRLGDGKAQESDTEQSLSRFKDLNDDDDDGMAESLHSRSDTWKAARDLLATAGDDGNVKVWRLVASGEGLSAVKAEEPPSQTQDTTMDTD